MHRAIAPGRCRSLAVGVLVLLGAGARGDLALLTLEGWSGSVPGFPPVYVVNRVWYDSNAATPPTVVGNVTTVRHPLQGYELVFDGAELAPLTPPVMHITDTLPGGPYGNPDDFYLSADLDAPIGGWWVTGFHAYAFDPAQTALENVDPPRNLDYFDGFPGGVRVQIDLTDGPSTQAVFVDFPVLSLDAVPEQSTGLLLGLGLSGLVWLTRRRGQGASWRNKAFR